MATDTDRTGSHIRFATKRDLNRILEIERLSFAKQWDYMQFHEALKDLFLVFEEKEILGFLIACYSELSHRAMIMRIAVHPDHRNKGIGTRLIEALLDTLKLMKVREVELDVEIVKRGAIRLYEKFGFQVYKAIPVNYEENEGFFIMVLKLDNK